MESERLRAARLGEVCGVDDEACDKFWRRVKLRLDLGLPAAAFSTPNIKFDEVFLVIKSHLLHSSVRIYYFNGKIYLGGLKFQWSKNVRI